MGSSLEYAKFQEHLFSDNDIKSFFSLRSTFSQMTYIYEIR